MWRRQKDYGVLSDAQPDKITYAIRLALLAKHRQLKHLPYFTALEISEHSLQMKLSKHQLNLREAINDMAFISEYGYLVIRNLLEMLQELR